MASAASEVGAGGGEAAAAAGGGVVLHGNTALHVAALTGNAAEVSRLLAEGAEIVENEFGKLPEDVASNDSIVSVLRAARKEQTKAAMAELRALRVRVKDLESKHTAAEKKLEKQAYRIHHLCRNVQQLHSAATNDAGATIGFPGMVPTGHTQYSWTGPLAEAGAGWLPSQS